jgi:8-hydroxy-5-deazaflavin:NADPH oxidoreductase
MEITIIGTGNMARGVATRALAGGHSVALLGTETAKAQALADELSGDARAGQVGGPLSGDVVVLAVWYAAVDDVLRRYGDQLAAKVVVDITNPIDVESFEPLALEAGSAAQEIAAKAPGAKVVKAFNTTFAGPLGEGRVAGYPLDVLIASDDAAAKQTLSRVVARRRRRRHAPHRRRAAQARPRDRGARLPAHGAPEAARHQLCQRCEGPVVSGAHPSS